MGKLTVIDGKKKCRKCGENKTTDYFNYFTDPRYGKKYIASNCKECIKLSCYAWRKKNPKKESLLKQKHNEKIKTKVIQAYSKSGEVKCDWCGFSDIRALCIDHVNNNGAEERRRLKDKTFAGRNFYKWLIDNNFPEGYQILCANCNLIKEIERRRSWK
jgi:hypothetical protein